MSRRKKKESDAKLWAEKLKSGEIKQASEQKLAAIDRKKIEAATHEEMVAKCHRIMAQFPKPSMVHFKDGCQIVNCRAEFAHHYGVFIFSITRGDL